MLHFLNDLELLRENNKTVVEIYFSPYLQTSFISNSLFCFSAFKNSFILKEEK